VTRESTAEKFIDTSSHPPARFCVRAHPGTPQHTLILVLQCTTNGGQVISTISCDKIPVRTFSLLCDKYHILISVISMRIIDIQASDWIAHYHAGW